MYRTFFITPKLRIFKIIYVNFRSLPFSQAIHLPIYVYGKVRIYCLNGSMEIKGPVKRGIIKIGMPTFGLNIDYVRTYLLMQGILYLKENVLCVITV